MTCVSSSVKHSVIALCGPAGLRDTGQSPGARTTGERREVPHAVLHEPLHLGLAGQHNGRMMYHS